MPWKKRTGRNAYASSRKTNHFKAYLVNFYNNIGGACSSLIAVDPPNAK